MIAAALTASGCVSTGEFEKAQADKAELEQQTREALLAGKPAPKKPTGKGFLQTTDKWQDPYVAGTKGRELAYFLR